MVSNEVYDLCYLKLCKSASGAKLGPTHPGRPGDEEPHVKKTCKGKREISEYIVRVDQVRTLLAAWLYLT